MTGKEILFKALRNEATPRPAWVPFVGVHGGKMIGASAEDFLHSSDLIVQGLTKACQLYQPDGLPVVFDLQVEAEVLGCQMRWAHDTPPSVSSHPLDTMSLDELPKYDTSAGRWPVIIEALKTMKAQKGEVAWYGLITGPFTLGLHLMGTNIFLDMFQDVDKVRSVLEFCTEVGKASADAYLDHGADVIAVVDPMTSQISPVHFQEFVSPYIDAVFDHVRQRGAFSSLFVCGNATRNLEKMCASHCDNVSVDENISLTDLRHLAEQNNKSFGGNLKLTTVLLLGSQLDAQKDALACMETGGTQGFVLAPGCDLPYATPEENLQAVAGIIHDEYQRDVVRAMPAEVKTFDDVELPDYARENQVIVDVVTLDSASCAPCQYMVDAVMNATSKLGNRVVVREHKITTENGLGHMAKLGVGMIPTICIDGEVKFPSIIPDVTTLTETIEQRITEKDKGKENQ